MTDEVKNKKDVGFNLCDGMFYLQNDNNFVKQ